VNPSTLKYFDAPGSPMYMQEFLYSLKNHRYTATMLQHIAEDRDGRQLTEHRACFEKVAMQIERMAEIVMDMPAGRFSR
jgi:hypothetical protein